MKVSIGPLVVLAIFVLVFSIGIYSEVRISELNLKSADSFIAAIAPKSKNLMDSLWENRSQPVADTPKELKDIYLKSEFYKNRAEVESIISMCANREYATDSQKWSMVKEIANKVKRDSVLVSQLIVLSSR